MKVAREGGKAHRRDMVGAKRKEFMEVKNNTYNIRGQIKRRERRMSDW